MAVLPKSDSGPLTFHVLYIPGTVRDLRMFAPSLAIWGNGCKFRLVSNGCSPAEDQLLQEIAQRSPQFEFYRLPSLRMWAHGRALAYLQQRETGSRFAFLDSDIFATGDFLSDLQPHTDALFSCPPVWSNDQISTLPVSFRLASGPTLRTETGMCIGGSYFAIYDNRILNNFIGKYGIDLRPYLWEAIPAEIRTRLCSAGLEKAYYDTTKLMNLLMNLDGFDCQLRTSLHLHHVGGISATSPPRDLLAWAHKGVVRLLPGFVRQLVAWTGLRDNWRAEVPIAERNRHSSEAARRRLVCAHVFQLLNRLNQNEHPDSHFDCEDAELVVQVRRLETALCENYSHWRAWHASERRILDNDPNALNAIPQHANDSERMVA